MLVGVFPLLIAFIAALVILVVVLTHSQDEAARMRPSWHSLERLITWLAVVFAVVAAAGLVVIPTYATVTDISSAGGQAVTQRGRETLLSVNGLEVLPFVLLPVLLASIPLFRGTPHQRRVRAALVAVLLIGFTILGGFSIGLFYVPSALAMLAVAALGVLSERTA